MAEARSQALMIGEAGQTQLDAERLMRSIAQQVARDLIPVEDIAKLHNLTMEQLTELRQNHAFNAMLLEELATWKDIDNAPERIKNRYLMMLEMSAPEFFAALIDGKTNLRDRTDLLKVIMKGANIGNEAPANVAAAAAGSKVNIVINMGNAKLTMNGLPTRVNVDNNVNREMPVISPDGYAVQDDEPVTPVGNDFWLDHEGDTPDYTYLIESEAAQ